MANSCSSEIGTDLDIKIRLYCTTCDVTVGTWQETSIGELTSKWIEHSVAVAMKPLSESFKRLDNDAST